MHNALRLEKLAGLSLVLALHAGLLYGAWSSQLIPPPKEAVTLFVSLINPPPKKEEPLPEPPKPIPHKKVVLDKSKPVEQPKPVPMLVVQTPVISEAEFTAPIAEPVPESPPTAHESASIQAEPPKPAAPVMMPSELSLVCPHRTTPDYPAVSRRMGESGRVVLRVELDEAGHIAVVRVKESSGHKRLDEAGLATVKTWQCHAAMRGGEAVRAVALQPFDFVLN